MKRSRASRGSVRQEACSAHAARSGIAARERPPPRSALRASLGHLIGHPHLAPRSARRAERTRGARPSPRSALRASLGTHAWGAGALAKAAALRGNLMAPEAMRGNLMAPERLLRGARAQGAKVRKCHDGVWNTLGKRAIPSRSVAQREASQRVLRWFCRAIFLLMAAASLRCSVPGLTRCPPHQRPRRIPSRIRRCRQSSQVRPDICTKVENRTSSRSTPYPLEPKLQVYSFPLDQSRVRTFCDKSKIYTIDILGRPRVASVTRTKC